jgi:hypothetical protein
MSFKLTAINRCLRAIGETPVNSIASDVPDAVEARALVEDTTKEVLSAGWHSNVDYNITLSPDAETGHIVIPSDYISVDTVGYSSHIDVTIRQDPEDDQLKLFNVGEQTFEFEDDITVDVIRDFDIDALPYPLQNYIGWHSARLFQKSTVASTALDAMLVENEAIAWGKLLDWEAESDDTNILRGSLYMRRVTGRNNDLAGGGW